MAHLLAALSLAVALVGVGSAADSGTSRSADCQSDIRTTTPNVADRLEYQLESCESQQSAAGSTRATLADCVTEARRDGFRPADRLEHSIRVCLGQPAVGATAP